MDEKYFRPSKDQLEKIVPKIESATTTNIDSNDYVSVDLIDPTQKFYNSQFDLRIDALEKRISELEQENRNIKHSLSELENKIKDERLKRL